MFTNDRRSIQIRPYDRLNLVANFVTVPSPALDGALTNVAILTYEMSGYGQSTVFNADEALGEVSENDSMDEDVETIEISRLSSALKMVAKALEVVREVQRGAETSLGEHEWHRIGSRLVKTHCFIDPFSPKDREPGHGEGCPLPVSRVWLSGRATRYFGPDSQNSDRASHERFMRSAGDSFYAALETGNADSVIETLSRLLRERNSLSRCGAQVIWRSDAPALGDDARNRISHLVKADVQEGMRANAASSSSAPAPAIEQLCLSAEDSEIRNLAATVILEFRRTSAGTVLPPSEPSGPVMVGTSRRRRPRG